MGSPSSGSEIGWARHRISERFLHSQNCQCMSCNPKFSVLNCLPEVCKQQCTRYTQPEVEEWIFLVFKGINAKILQQIYIFLS